MLSKLFLNIRLGIELWFVAFAVLFLAGQYFLTGQGHCARLMFIPDYDMVRPVISVFLALAGLVFSHQVFVKRFFVIKGSFFIPFTLLLVLSVVHPFFCPEYSLLLLLTIALFFNFYSITERGADRSIPYFINIGIISFLVFLYTPLGVVFLLSSWIHTVLQGNRGWRSFAVPLYVMLFGTGVFLLLDFAFGSVQGSMRLIEQLKPQFIGMAEVTPYLVEFTAMGVMLLFALKEYRSMLYKAPVAKRKIMSLLVWQVIISLLGFIVFGGQKDFIWLALFGTAILFANYIHYVRRNWVREVWFWVLIVVTFLPWFERLLSGWI